MHTDREASDQDGRPALPSTPASAEPVGTPELPSSQEPTSHGPAHEYGYGNDEELPAPGAVEPAEPAQPTEGPDDLAETERRSVTGVQGVTAPRAMLREVPEGFPTPPPRPARPNRRPAKAEDPAESRGPRRGLLIGAIVMVAVLVFAVVVGGGLLAFRALSSGGSDPATPAATSGAPQDGAAGGSTTIGDVTMTVVSTEVGVASVGDRGSPAEPAGEFVIVTVEVANAGDAPASLTAEAVSLETADGATHPLDLDASNAHVADTESPGIVSGGSTESVHLVFDAPIGAEPTALGVDLGADRTGSLPLAG